MKDLIRQKLKEVLLVQENWSELDYVKPRYSFETLVAVVEMLDQWVKYDFNNIHSRPPKPDKYFVCRKDGKLHWETWNGSGWAYNEKSITHWKEVLPPRI